MKPPATSVGQDGLRQRMAARTAFGLLGGPAAWFAQLLVGYALASGPCFPHDQRLAAPPPQWTWSHAGIVLMVLLCTVVALAALRVSWSDLRGGSRRGAPAGRARFIAAWGVALGGGFCVATLLTAVGIALLPRCAG